MSLLSEGWIEALGHVRSSRASGSVSISGQPLETSRCLAPECNRRKGPDQPLSIHPSKLKLASETVKRHYEGKQVHKFSSRKFVNVEKHGRGKDGWSREGRQTRRAQDNVWYIPGL